MKQFDTVAAALILPLCFLNPVAIFQLNPQFAEISFGQVMLIFGGISLILIIVYAFVLRLLPPTPARIVMAGSMALAVVLYVQAQILSPRVVYDLTGEVIDWTELGNWPVYEITLLAMIFIAGSYLAWRQFHRIGWIAGFLLFAATVSAAADFHRGTAIFTVSGQSVQQEFDDAVFGFSSAVNIVHLMPDAVQSNVATAVLVNNPELAARLEGFILYDAHLGVFQSTAPTIPTVFNGEIYDLTQGYVAREVREQIQRKSYATHLREAGVRLDFATASPLACVDGHATCVYLPFSSDFRSRGYETIPDARAVSMALIADLSLFRQLPVVLKKHVYSGGAWWLSEILAEVTVDYTVYAPVLEEWRRNAHVVDREPRYKWYHWIGAHTPQSWNRNCRYIGPQEWRYPEVAAQTECVLLRIAGFAERLRELGIYDETFIIVSSDHGSNQRPEDVKNYSDTDLFRLNEVGTARPLLLLKPFNSSGEFRTDSAQTSLIDIAPTILDALGIQHSYDGMNILDIPRKSTRSREYHRYARPPFRWIPDPVPFDRFIVTGDTRDWDNWILAGLFAEEDAPEAIQQMNDPDIRLYVRGIAFRPDSDETWALVRGRDLALLLKSDKAGAHELSVKLGVPGPIDGQAVELHVNGKHMASTQTIEATDADFQPVRFCIPEKLLNGNGGNLFHLRFANARPIHENDSREFSAIVRSARLSPRAECS